MANASAAPPTQPRVTDRELLSRLGLAEGAGNRDVEAAHDMIVAFLEQAPPDLTAWARREAEAADEALALLADPGARAAAEATDGAAQADESAEAAEPPPGLVTRIRQDPAKRRIAIGLGVVAAAAVVVGVYRSGGDEPSSTAQARSTAAAAASKVDAARLATLMRAVAQSPGSPTPLVQIGDLYFQAGEYATAAQWMEKAVALAPGNATARLALGAAWFNLGKRAKAETEWKRVVATSPRNVEAHYDLGFLYLSAKPADMARVRAEWNKVVALAPKSDVAKTVRAHLQQIGSGASASGASSPASGGK